MRRARLVGRAIAQIQAEVVLKPSIQRILDREFDSFGARLALRDRTQIWVLCSLDHLLGRRQWDQPRLFRLGPGYAACQYNSYQEKSAAYPVRVFSCIAFRSFHVVSNTYMHV